MQQVGRNIICSIKILDNSTRSVNYLQSCEVCVQLAVTSPPGVSKLTSYDTKTHLLPPVMYLTLFVKIATAFICLRLVSDVPSNKPAFSKHDSNITSSENLLSDINIYFNRTKQFIN